ncbi:MAG: hypothetical protein CMH54_05645, partial [Myxococcales bacterium]|nr:hypothetical protein [Myxococcales bacterium]
EYQVAATWAHKYNNRYNTLDAPFSITNGSSGTVLATATVNQQNAPSEFVDEGYDWDTLATVNVTGGSLVVTLGAGSSRTKYTVADAIRIEKLAGVSPTLTVTIADVSIVESAGAAATTATVTRTETIGDLVVTLTSDDTSEATVPATVTILDGEASATFDIAAVDDIISDGTQAVTISATAIGYSAGSDTLLVTEKDLFDDFHDQLDPDTQNERLFNGYTHTRLRSRTLGVDVKGLNAYFDSYDVYVYIDADDSESGPGHSVRSVSDGTTTYYLDDPQGNTFTGTFVEVSSTDRLAPGLGNFVVFRDVTSDAFSLRIDDEHVVGGGWRNSPAINGLQIVGGPDKDGVVIGGDFDVDTVVGDNGEARLLNDELVEFVTTDHSIVDSTVQADFIQGGEDADVLVGGNGIDEILGEEGHDLILGDNAKLLVFEGKVRGLDFHGGADDAIEGGVDVYDVLGLELLDDNIGGDDMLEGGKDDDLIYGQYGNDSFVFAGGGLGSDVIVESRDSDSRSNDPHDRLDFSSFIGMVDVDLGRSRTQTVNGELFEGDTNLKIQLHPRHAVEDVTGSEFDDKIEGNQWHNTLIGLSGNDELDGLSGDDVLIGSDGDDVIIGGEDDDLIDGSLGDDRLFGGGSDSQSNDLSDNELNVILGGPGADQIEGGRSVDLIDGEAGVDDIIGKDGNDILLGGLDDDTLMGDDGADVIEGGPGRDKFVTILDDGDIGFTHTGFIYQDNIQVTAAYDGDNHNMQGGSGTASWTFSGLVDGEYQVAATWAHKYNNRYNTLDAPFSIVSGSSGTVLATATVNQQNAPSEFVHGGYGWDMLGTVNVTGGSLVVTLGAGSDSNKYTVADAIRIARLEDISPTVTESLAHTSVTASADASSTMTTVIGTSISSTTSDVVVEPETGAGLLGLRAFFESFALAFEQTSFFFEDPNEGNTTPTDDRPPRIWVESFLDELPPSHQDMNPPTLSLESSMDRALNTDEAVFGLLGRSLGGNDELVGVQLESARMSYFAAEQRLFESFGKLPTSQLELEPLPSRQIGFEVVATRPRQSASDWAMDDGVTPQSQEKGTEWEADLDSMWDDDIGDK